MKKIIILTGDELRHQYLRRIISLSPGIEVLASYCEGPEKSLQARVTANENSSELMKRHVSMRLQSEEDFFSNLTLLTEDKSAPIKINKGAINDKEIVEKIILAAPDLIVCYGSSLIKGELLAKFAGRFLNVHLGLSPYYRGSGTNVWPLINNEPEYVGATFMYIDPGIDTGEIIHQMRAKICFGDTPHQIGNRLISDISLTYVELICNFDRLKKMRQPDNIPGKLYYIKDFDEAACQKLYANFAHGLVDKYLALRDTRERAVPLLENPGLGKSRG